MEVQAESNEVQNKYLDLLQRVRISKEEILVDKDKLEDLISASNMLFKKIKTSSELKLDARITAISTKMACSRMEKDLDSSFVTSEKLIELFRNDLLDDFYRHAMECSLGISFLGHLSFVREENRGRQRLQSQRSRLVPSEAEFPRLATTDDNTMNKPEMLVRIREMLKKEERINYFSCVVDPSSFARTIENIFSLSLAIYSSVASLEYDRDVLYVRSSESCTGEGSGHLIVELSYDEYLEIVKKMGMDDVLVQD